MGDYSNAQLVVYSCPPEEVRAFTALIGEHDLKDDWCGKTPPNDEIILGHTYCDNDVNVGFVENSNIDAPNSAWVRFNDPKYEWLGQLEMHVPGLGYFRAACDAEGDAQFNTDTLVAVIENLPVDASRDQVLQAIDKLTGKAWRVALGELVTWEFPNDGPVVKAAPVCAWCEELIIKVGDGWTHKATLRDECADQKVHRAEPDEEP